MSLQEKAIRLKLDAFTRAKDCGANAPGGGGFQPGNTCARGGGAGEAATKTEAEAYAAKFCSGKVSYRGMSVEHANEVNKELDSLWEKYELEPLTAIKAQSFDRAGFNPQAVAAYRGGIYNRQLYLNTAILGDAKRFAAYEAENKKAADFIRARIDKPEFAHLREKGHALLSNGHVNTSMRGFVKHEIGHHADNHYRSGLKGQTREQRQAAYNRRAQALTQWASRAPSISHYATTDSSEYVAEAFVAHEEGRNIDPPLASMFRDLRRR